MRGIQLLKAGKIVFNDDVESPQILNPTSVMIKIKYSSVNMVDTYHVSGAYPVPNFPCVIGCDGSGVVAKIGGNVKRIKVGDKVCFNAFGSYAEYIVCDEERVVKFPSDVGFKNACASMVNGLTAHYLTHSTYKVTNESVVVILAVAGATGQWVQQICKKIGATVIGVCSKGKHEFAKENGTDYVIDYEDFDKKVLRICDILNVKGVDVVYDSVGKATYKKSMRCVKQRGLLCLFGNASGKVDPIDPLDLLYQGSIYLTRPSLRHHILNGEIVERSKSLFKWIQEGLLQVKIHKIYPLEDAPLAHSEIKSRNTLGKILLQIF